MKRSGLAAIWDGLASIAEGWASLWSGAPGPDGDLEIEPAGPGELDIVRRDGATPRPGHRERRSAIASGWRLL